MSIGLTYNKTHLDTVMGSLARDLKKTMDDSVELYRILVALPDADLVSMGYTSNEVAVLKTAWSDASQLAGIFNGGVTLLSAKDFRVFLKQLWGLGDLTLRF